MSNQQFQSIMCGKLLGDGSLNMKNQARLQFRHSLKDKRYTEDQLQLFSQYLTFGPTNPKANSYKDWRTGKTYKTLICQSHVDSRLTILYPQWYVSKKKVIPIHLLKSYFNAESLAIWFQDDGSLKSKSRIILSAECFQPHELLFLQKLLMEKFSLHAHIDTQNRLDICSRQEVELFLTYVSPFLSQGMKRKSLSDEYAKLQNETWQLIQKYETLYEQAPCRTTIYLPPALKRFLQNSPSPSKTLSHLLQLKTELLNVHHPTVRRKRIIQSKNMIATEAQKVPYTIYINTFQFNSLKLLKKWTGIDISNYIKLLLKDVS